MVALQVRIALHQMFVVTPIWFLKAEKLTQCSKGIQISRSNILQMRLFYFFVRMINNKLEISGYLNRINYLSNMGYIKFQKQYVFNDLYFCNVSWYIQLSFFFVKFCPTLPLPEAWQSFLRDSLDANVVGRGEVI